MNKLYLYYEWWKNWQSFPVKPWVLGANYHRQKDYSKAIEYYKKGIRTHGKHPAAAVARMDLAFCLIKVAEFSEAEFHLRQVVYNKKYAKKAYLKLLSLYMHIGNYLEAAWCAKRALDEFPECPLVQSFFIFSVVENGGPASLLIKIEELKDSYVNDSFALALRHTAQAVYELSTGQKEKASKIFAHVLLQRNIPYQAYMYYGNMLLRENEVMLARYYLRKALKIAPSNPKIVRLFAETYLKPGPLYKPEFAKQLATTAAQRTNWKNPWCLHILAEAYHLSGNNMAALITATKAKNISKTFYEFYPRQELLGELIDTLEGYQ